MKTNDTKFIRVEVSGKDKSLWSKFQPKFIETVNKFLDSVIDEDRNSTIREEAKMFTSALLDYGKEKLKKAGVENEKVIAEIDLTYTQKQKVLAETRKLHAEADKVELQNNIKRLRIALSGMKILMIGEGNDEEIVFVKQIDSFLKAVKQIESNDDI